MSMVIVVVVHAGRHLPSDCRLRLALLANAAPGADAPPPPPVPTDALWVPTQPLRFELAWPHDDATPIVSIEVWDCAKAYDSFVAAVQRPASATAGPEWWTFPASNMALHISVVCKTTTTTTPPRTMDFSFEVPSHRIDWRALQHLHLGAIIHQVDTAALEACLDVVLYGDCNEDGELYPAMILLQLAAQYANFCCETIAVQTSKLHGALDAAVARRRRLQEKQSHATAKIEQLRRQHASLDDVLATFARVSSSTTTPP